MSSQPFYVYDAAGKIRRWGACPASMVAAQAGAGEFVRIGAANDALQYVDMADPDNPLVRDKPPIPYTRTGNSLSGLPNPTLVKVRMEGTPLKGEITVTDGALSVAADLPGRYVLTLISNPRYLETEITLDLA